MSAIESIKDASPKEDIIDAYKPGSISLNCLAVLKQDFNFSDIPNGICNSDIIRYATLSHLWDTINLLSEEDDSLCPLNKDITCLKDLNNIDNYYNYKIKRNGQDLFCISNPFFKNGVEYVMIIEIPLFGNSNIIFTIDTTKEEFRKLCIRKFVL